MLYSKNSKYRDLVYYFLVITPFCAVLRISADDARHSWPQSERRGLPPAPEVEKARPWLSPIFGPWSKRALSGEIWRAKFIDNYRGMKDIVQKFEDN